MQRRFPPPATDALHAAVARHGPSSGRDHAHTRVIPTICVFRGVEATPPLASCAAPACAAHVVVPPLGTRSGRHFQ